MSDRGTTRRPGTWRAIGGLMIAEIVSNEALAPTNSEAHAVSRNDAWCLILQIDGRSVLKHGGATFALGPGDLALVGAGASLRHRAVESSRVIVVYLPNSLMLAHLPAHPPAPPLIVDGRDGIAMMLSGMAHSLLHTTGSLCKREGAGIRDAIAHLAAAAYSARRDACRDYGLAPQATPRPARNAFTRNWVTLQRSIDAVLSDPLLSPARVAAQNRMSTRHLHRLLKQAGTSFTAYVRTRRLEQCRNDLADPVLWTLPLTEIAYRWGFNDSSHFSRCFKAAFGCTAREFRARETGSRPLPIQSRANESCASTPLASDDHTRDRTPFVEGWRLP